VAYPFAFYGTEELKSFSGKIYFIGGTHDEIGPADALLEFYNNLPLVDKYLKIIPTDHFYGGKEGEIVEFIKDQVSVLKNEG
jgi:alpha/beta superfamily hydrolase